MDRAVNRWQDHLRPENRTPPYPSTTLNTEPPEPHSILPQVTIMHPSKDGPQTAKYNQRMKRQHTLDNVQHLEPFWIHPCRKDLSAGGPLSFPDQKRCIMTVISRLLGIHQAVGLLRRFAKSQEWWLWFMSSFPGVFRLWCHRRIDRQLNYMDCCHGICLTARWIHVTLCTIPFTGH